MFPLLFFSDDKKEAEEGTQGPVSSKASWVAYGLERLKTTKDSPFKDMKTTSKAKDFTHKQRAALGTANIQYIKENIILDSIRSVTCMVLSTAYSTSETM